MKTGLIYCDTYLEHDTGTHPENGDRVAKTMEHLKSSSTFSSLETVNPVAATEDVIGLVHAKDMINRVKELSQNGGGSLDPDTLVSNKSFDVALLAAGGVTTAIDQVLSGKIKNAFCLCRPPGHHANKFKSTGFCVFNNIAIGAAHLKKQGIKKILIIDFDVHHGNGTQDIFYDDKEVLYISLHRHPFYPGTGMSTDTGSGKGAGFTLNIPLPGDTPADDYLLKLNEALSKTANVFDPEFVLVSAGFDGFVKDPLGSFSLENGHFEKISESIHHLANDCCDGKAVAVLEGGYHVDSLPGLVESYLKGMIK